MTAVIAAVIDSRLLYCGYKKIRNYKYYYLSWMDGYTYQIMFYIKKERLMKRRGEAWEMQDKKKWGKCLKNSWQFLVVHPNINNTQVTETLILDGFFNELINFVVLLYIQTNCTTLI